MNAAIVGLYGIYLILTGINGNAEKFLRSIASEKGFVPWIVAVLVLGALSENGETKPLVAPFVTLLIVALVVTRWNVVSGQVKTVYGTLAGGAQTAASPEFWQSFMRASPSVQTGSQAPPH